MRKHVPEGVFREEAAAKSGDAVVDPNPVEQAPDGRNALPALSRGIAPRVVVASLIGALLLGFAGGRLLAATVPEQPPVPPSSPTSSPSASVGRPSPSPTAQPTLVPYDGPVRRLPVLDATGVCLDGPNRDEPANLIDANPQTIWRCPGDGIGEEIVFKLDPRSTLVGVRLVNGNTAWVDGYLSERRILSIRWDFSDGSYLVQGLSANDPSWQEIRFPPLQGATWVRLTVQDATPAGGTEESSDAVSISALDFLTAAQ